MTPRRLTFPEALTQDRLLPLILADEPVFVSGLDMVSLIFVNAAGLSLLAGANENDSLAHLKAGLDQVQNDIETEWPCTLDFDGNGTEKHPKINGRWQARQTRLVKAGPRYIIFTRLRPEPDLLFKQKVTLYWNHASPASQISAMGLFRLDVVPAEPVIMFGQSQFADHDYLLNVLTHLQSYEWRSVCPNVPDATDMGNQHDNQNSISYLLVRLVCGEEALGLIIGVGSTLDNKTAVTRPDDKETSVAALPPPSLETAVAEEVRVAAFFDARGEVLALSDQAKALEGRDKLIFSDLTSDMINPISQTRLNDQTVKLSVPPGQFRVLIETAPETGRFHYCMALIPDKDDPDTYTDSPETVSIHGLNFMFQTDENHHIVSVSHELKRACPNIAAWLSDKSLDALIALSDENMRSEFLGHIKHREHWSGLSIDVPLDGDEAVRLELCGLPNMDQAGCFTGFSGLGICKPLAVRVENLAERDVSDANDHDVEAFDNQLTDEEQANFQQLGHDIKRKIAPDIKSPVQTVLESRQAGFDTKFVPHIDQCLESPDEAYGLFQQGQLIEASASLLRMTGFDTSDSLSKALEIEGLTPVNTKGTETESLTGLMLLPHNQAACLMVRARLHIVKHEAQTFSLIVFQHFDARNYPAPVSLLTPLDMACDGYLILDRDDFIEQISPKLAHRLLWRPRDLEGRAVQAILSRESQADWQKENPLSSHTRAFQAYPRHVLKLIDRNGQSHYFQMMETDIQSAPHTPSEKGTKKTRLLAFHRLTSESMMTHLQRSVHQELSNNLSMTTALIDDLGDELSLPISHLVSLAGELRLRLGEQEQAIQPVAMAMVRSAVNLKRIVGQIQNLKTLRDEVTEQSFEWLSLSSLAEKSLSTLAPYFQKAEILLRTSFEVELPRLKVNSEQTCQLIKSLVLYTLSLAEHENILIVSLVARNNSQVLRIRFGPRQPEENRREDKGTEPVQGKWRDFPTENRRENKTIEPSCDSKISGNALDVDNDKSKDNQDISHHEALTPAINLITARALANAQGAHMEIRYLQGVNFVVEVIFPAARETWRV